MPKAATGSTLDPEAFWSPNCEASSTLYVTPARPDGTCVVTPNWVITRVCDWAVGLGVQDGVEDRVPVAGMVGLTWRTGRSQRHRTA
jgi:hypothetical protein